MHSGETNQDEYELECERESQYQPRLESRRTSTSAATTATTVSMRSAMSRVASRRLSMAQSTSIFPAQAQGEEDGGDLEYQLTQVASRHAVASVKEATEGEAAGRVLVEFAPNDIECPYNWSLRRRIGIMILAILVTLTCSLASSTYSAASEPISQYFGVSTLTSNLGLSLFLLSFCFSAVFAPISECYGRRYVTLIALACFLLLQLGVSLAQNFATIAICRFFGGIFASSSFSVIPGSVVDMFPPANRGYAIAFFSLATFSGPTMGPIIGSFIVMRQDMGWRWTSWIVVVLAGVMLVLATLFLPETYHPVILKHRARRLRREHNSDKYFAALEMQNISLGELASRQLIRPIIMLFTDGIILFISVHVGLGYGVQYAILSAFPVEFQNDRGWSPGVGSLPFLAVFVGIAIATLVVALSNPRYRRRMEQNGGRPVPEERMVPTIAGGIAFPVGLFWFGWAHYGPWPVQVVGSAFIGFSFSLIFMQSQSYLADAFPRWAASALAANAFLRAVIAFIFCMLTDKMYNNLGVPWASSLLGFLAAALAPVPFILVLYGHRIRASSRWAD